MGKGMLNSLADNFKKLFSNKINILLECVLVGIVAGGISILYRLALGYGDIYLRSILATSQNNVALILGWFLVLALLAFVVGKFVKWEPMISGSGIPQLHGEIKGHFYTNWHRVLAFKFVGGFLCILGGLSLGRSGPSVQMGAMAGKGVAKSLRKNSKEEIDYITCGAAAGLAATFNSPIAGALLSIEGLHKKFSAIILIPILIASFTADLISKAVFGFGSIFSYKTDLMIPINYYWLLIILGVVLGLLCVLFDEVNLYAKRVYSKINWLKPQNKVLIPFLLAGVLSLVLPQVLGGGSSLVELLTKGNLTLNVLLLLLIAKFIFSIVCFGSPVPGGMFFPMLVIGAYIGGVYGNIAASLFGLDASIINSFIVLAMAGYFSGIVRTPITAIVLIAEMTGSFANIIPLVIVSFIAYFVARLLKSRSIFDNLLENMLDVAREA